MEDRELLELAAKASGYALVWGGVYIVDGENIDCTDLPYVRSNQQDEADWYWNPLEDDGDALRLAVKLQLGISIPPVVDGRIEVVTFYGPIISIVEYPQNNDRNAATRRAIVRAAAELGKQMS